MKKTSPQSKENREKAFAKIGEYVYEEKPKKTIPDELIETKTIYHDGRQYSCKLPIDILDAYWKKGDSLKFTRTKADDGKIEIKVEYVRGKIKK